MAHIEQKDFCLKIKQKIPNFFTNKFVLDVGSLDINGNNRYLFDQCVYYGIDIGEGKNVDYVCKAHEFTAHTSSYDVIISTECFEHDQYYDLSLKNILRILKPNGLFIFTCATCGRPEHGTNKTSPQDAPLLINYNEWSDYYKNLTEDDIRKSINIEENFKEFLFETNNISYDLYFYGIKK